MKERCDWTLGCALSAWRKLNRGGFSTGTVVESRTFASVAGGEGGRSKRLLGGVLMVLGLSPSIALSPVIDVSLSHLSWQQCQNM
jgi:hypothetical protein